VRSATKENAIMSNASQVQPGERDPNMPPGLLPITIVAVALCTFMYVLFPGHGPIQGHVAAPAANTNPG
jgi:hypothetical protein